MLLFSTRYRNMYNILSIFIYFTYYIIFFWLSNIYIETRIVVNGFWGSGYIMCVNTM